MSAELAFRSRPATWAASTSAPNGVRWCPGGPLAQIRQTTGPETLERFNNLPSVKIIGAGAPGFLRSGHRRRGKAAGTLPRNSATTGAAASFQEKKSSGSSGYAWPWAPSWSSPYPRRPMSAGPLLAGRLARPALRHLQHPGGGLVAGHEQRRLFPDRSGHLLGLAAKNAILIVPIRHLQAPGGHERGGSGIEAARLRFRPILMTSLAFISACCPRHLHGAGPGRARGGHRGHGRHAGGHLSSPYSSSPLLPPDRRPQAVGTATTISSPRFAPP